MGELHLDVLVDRMVREFAVAANVGKPQVAYRETITEPVETSRSATSARPVVAVSTATSSSASSPRAPVVATSSSTRSRGGDVPREYISAVDAGIQEAMEGGVIAGYALVDVRAILTGGSSHDVDSSEMAFKIAGSIAFKKAARQAKPVLLEPIMAGRGRHARRLHGRRHRRPELTSRARSRGWSSAATSHVVRAQVPLAEMFGYATDLRSRTQGRATYTMQFDSYQQVPQSIAEEITARVRGE